jgi:hypothetical protein
VPILSEWRLAGFWLVGSEEILRVSERWREGNGVGVQSHVLLQWPGVRHVFACDKLCVWSKDRLECAWTRLLAYVQAYVKSECEWTRPLTGCTCTRMCGEKEYIKYLEATAFTCAQIKE